MDGAMTPAEHMTVPEVVEFTALLRSVSRRLARFEHVPQEDLERLAGMRAQLLGEEET